MPGILLPKTTSIQIAGWSHVTKLKLAVYSGWGQVVPLRLGSSEGEELAEGSGKVLEEELLVLGVCGNVWLQLAVPLHSDTGCR